MIIQKENRRHQKTQDAADVPWSGKATPHNVRLQDLTCFFPEAMCELMAEPESKVKRWGAPRLSFVLAEPPR